MKIAVCGGTGFIGQALCRYWTGQGHQVMIVSRSKSTAGSTDNRMTYATWEDMKLSPELFEGLDALVNLAGSPLSQRWSKAGKARIYTSRLKTTAAVAALMRRLEHKPPAVIQASAMAIYGTSESHTFNENSPVRETDFPSRVVKAWEEAADQIDVERLVKLRISVVLGNDGGAFPKMMLPYKLGMGGKIGSGRQWMSWIHIEDIVRLIDYCVLNPDISGPVNAASPNPVTNDEFGRAVSAVYRRPHWFPVPAVLMKAALGELSLILLEGQRVIPAAAERHGFRFLYPELPQALKELKDSGRS